MEIPGISANDPLSIDPSGARTTEADKDTFMQLLVTQLKTQDPLNPTQNEDFLAQLATFSSVEELQQMNDSLVAMITLNQSNALLAQMTQSSALIGKDVSWTDPLSGESHEGRVDSVRIVDGVAYLRVEDQDVPLAAVTGILGEGMSADDAASTGSSEMSSDEIGSEEESEASA